ncbi:MAG: 4-(cytidine 5'-diphospho)-2-C-methyl-D-erythritol kinase [Rhodospirillales bacterium]|nr:4-(cytidine 5'-diphospho)-2-C-methyl-D-erythritol kinase [Rhodospirillales bacterium]MBO6785198.1 4-(cytidine 5'-diphospho)-2-C-methyl-D-erythritol kinase [Rhodospirillales bacterium]
MAAETPPVREPAPAKLNLYLHVTGRRDDGYHLLDSLVVFADTGDRIEVRAADDLTLEYAGPFAGSLPAPADNLVMRAAAELAALFGVDAGAHITLFKSLPVASGIGGGSADAAAALRALIRLWQIPPDDGRVSTLALSLGADVPVCLMTRPALMRGIGEDLTLLGAFPELPLVLVNPGVGVSTPQVFKARTGDFSAPADWPAATATAGDVLAALATTANDLEAPARELVPVIGDVIARLETQPGIRLARMSGSGATCFGIFETADAASAAAEAVCRAEPDWWVHAGATFGA